MNALWQQAVDRLQAADVAWCLLRAGDAAAAAARCVELDLLVDPAHAARLDQTLRGCGFVRLRPWGYAPHRFYVGYDEPADRWLKLDVVDRIAFGRPIHAIATALGPLCLDRRRLNDGAPVPVPEHEFLMLLLHAILDKHEFTPARQERLQALADQCDPAAMTELLAAYCVPAQTWTTLRAELARGGWDELLRLRGDLVRRLTGSSPLRYRARRLRDSALRKLYRVARLVQRPAPAVALLAPDGGGKSTLAAALCDSFFFPVRRIYMGLPARGPVRRRRIPGGGLALTLLRQWTRYLAGRFHRGRGRLVVFDRYPWDALLPPARPLGRLRRLRRWLLAHACPAPDLIVVLDAPGELLHERKGEHAPALLERQRQGYLELGRRMPKSVVIDGSRDADRVRTDVTARVWQCYRQRDLLRGGQPR